MSEPIRCDGYRLKREYYDVWQEFDGYYGDRCCSCHINPPCGFCTAEGNPLNLLEDDGAWEHPLKHAVISSIWNGMLRRFQRHWKDWRR